MKIAIDLDNTITASKESIEFFEVMTNLLIPEHKIYILTDREEPNSHQDVANELDYLCIEYSEIVIIEKKEEYIRGQGINIFFESGDKFLVLDEETTVFKISEDGDFVFSAKK